MGGLATEPLPSGKSTKLQSGEQNQHCPTNGWIDCTEQTPRVTKNLLFRNKKTPRFVTENPPVPLPKKKKPPRTSTEFCRIIAMA